MPIMSSLDATPWAYDCNNNELDPELKAAHRVALKLAAFDEKSDNTDTEAELAEPLLLPGLLSAEQVDDILAQVSVPGVWPRGQDGDCKEEGTDDVESKSNSKGGLSDELKSVAHHLAWTDEHVVLYMHMENWFVRTHPVPWSLIRGAMESQPDMEGVPVLADEWIGSDQSMQRVRCIELHHYARGGGLVTPGHRDIGSALTISILLSDPHEVEGGDFVTYNRKGAPVAHKMGLGDAILFNSEDLHNVCTVTGGVRQSLVVELWPSESTPISHGRYK